jgi:hypothetical protein
MGRHTLTNWTLTVLSVAILSKTPQQWLYRVAMNTKMSFANPAWSIPIARRHHAVTSFTKSGPAILTWPIDNHLRLVYLRDRFQTSGFIARSIPWLRPISSRTVRKRLRDRHIRPCRPAIRPMLLHRHRAARLTYYDVLPRSVMPPHTITLPPPNDRTTQASA